MPPLKPVVFVRRVVAELRRAIFDGRAVLMPPMKLGGDRGLDFPEQFDCTTAGLLQVPRKGLARESSFVLILIVHFFLGAVVGLDLRNCPRVRIMLDGCAVSGRVRRRNFLELFFDGKIGFPRRFGQVVEFVLGHVVGNPNIRAAAGRVFPAHGLAAPPMLDSRQLHIKNLSSMASARMSASGDGITHEASWSPHSIFLVRTNSAISLTKALCPFFSFIFPYKAQGEPAQAPLTLLTSPHSGTRTLRLARALAELG